MKGMYPAVIFSLLMGAGVSAGLAQSGDRGLASKTLPPMGRSYEKLSEAEARKAAREADERVAKEYAGQAAPPRAARARLAALARPAISSDRPAMRVRQVWAGPGANTLGQPSLDGRYLSFVDWATGDLAVRDLASGKNRRLTHKGSWQNSKEYAHFSTISPDGRRVAYAWLNKKNFYELRVVDLDRSRVRLPHPNLEMRFVEPSVVPADETPMRMLYRDKDEFSLGLDGSQPRVLYRNEEVQFIKPSAWSPDGKQILALFFGKGILNQIVLVSVADGSVRVLKSPLWIYPKKMSFSPDGRYVVYDLNEDPHFPQRDIFVLSTDGSREIPLVKHVADDMFPVWAPDGGSILFASNRTGTLDAWVIRVADGKPLGSPVLVKRNLGRFLPMGFTSKGAFYYGLRAGTEDAYIAALDLATGKLLKSPAPVSQRFPGANRSPDWSPDGQYLAYLSRVGTENQGLETRVITIRSLKDGEERRLVPKLGYLDWLRWSPDGRSLLVGGSSDTRNSSGVYRVDAQTGDLSPIVLAASEAPNGLQAVWSADGEAIFYIHEGLDGSYSIRFRDLESGQERNLYQAAPSLRLNNLALSPDGRRLAFGLSRGHSVQAGVLLVMPAAGGPPRELLRLKRAGLSGVAWARDGSQLLFSRGGEPAPELWRIPVQGGQPRRLGLATNQNARISLHPDGRQIAYTAGETKMEVWVMENFLPEFELAE